MDVVCEVSWHVIGRVEQTEFQLGKKDRPFWRLILSTPTGFLCIFVRPEHLRLIVEDLVHGDIIEAAGTISTHKTLESSRKPLFLEARELVRRDS